MKVSVLNEYPFPLVFGGVELQCQRTVSALRKRGIDIEFMNYHEVGAYPTLIHFFGNPPGQWDTVSLIQDQVKLVISVVLGAQPQTRIHRILGRAKETLVERIGVNSDRGRLTKIFKRANAVICLNEIERQTLARVYGVSLGKINIVPNGVDDVFRSPDPLIFSEKYQVDEYLLFTGSICQRKNPIMLAKAALLANKRAVFVGDGLPWERQYCNDFASLVNKSKNLLWIRKLESDSKLLASAYAAANLYVLPSAAETQPQGALEALAAGKRVVLGDKFYAYSSPFNHSQVVRCKLETKALAIKIEENFSTNFNQMLPVSIASWHDVGYEIASIYESLLN